MCTLTNHKKSVRALTLHPKYYSMASASPDNIKEWKFPNCDFIQNLSGHNAILNALAVNSDNVLVSAGKYKEIKSCLLLPLLGCTFAGSIKCKEYLSLS